MDVPLFKRQIPWLQQSSLSAHHVGQNLPFCFGGFSMSVFQWTLPWRVESCGTLPRVHLLILRSAWPRTLNISSTLALKYCSAPSCARPGGSWEWGMKGNLLLSSVTVLSLDDKGNHHPCPQCLVLCKWTSPQDRICPSVYTNSLVLKLLLRSRMSSDCLAGTACIIAPAQLRVALARAGFSTGANHSTAACLLYSHCVS